VRGDVNGANSNDGAAEGQKGTDDEKRKEIPAKLTGSC
jgi:hypothetical protein